MGCQNLWKGTGTWIRKAKKSESGDQRGYWELHLVTGASLCWQCLRHDRTFEADQPVAVELSVVGKMK